MTERAVNGQKLIKPASSVEIGKKPRNTHYSHLLKQTKALVGGWRDLKSEKIDLTIAPWYLTSSMHA
jgi:hypothetical protein